MIRFEKCTTKILSIFSPAILVKVTVDTVEVVLTGDVLMAAAVADVTVALLAIVVDVVVPDFVP